MLFSEEIVSQLDIKIESHYICYFDILGYREYMEENPTKHKTFLVNLEAVISKVESLIRYNNNGFDIKYRTYSDNFLIFAKRISPSSDSEMLKTFSILMRKIQIVLLGEFELLIRGGITIGEFFSNEQIVFGSALVRAYELESTIAKNPRIVIDIDKFELDINALLGKRLISLDFDNCFYVNYIDSYESIMFTRGKIISLVNTKCKYPYNVADGNKILLREKIIEKYIWLLTKFNSQCEQINYPKLCIEYELKINERLMKPEIRITKTLKTDVIIRRLSNG